VLTIRSLYADIRSCQGVEPQRGTKDTRKIPGPYKRLFVALVPFVAKFYGPGKKSTLSMVVFGAGSRVNYWNRKIGPIHCEWIALRESRLRVEESRSRGVFAFKMWGAVLLRRPTLFLCFRRAQARIQPAPEFKVLQISTSRKLQSSPSRTFSNTLRCRAMSRQRLIYCQAT